MENLVSYLRDIVEPTIKDFQGNPTSVRHAFLACVAVFHGIDYLAFPRKSRMLRQQFKKASLDFALVDQVAHAFKHVATRDLNATKVISRPPASFGEAIFDLSVFDDPTGGVTLDNHRDVDLLAVVKGAAEFLRKQTER